MTIASQLQDYADGLEDAYDAVNDMSGTIPQDRNMDNLDTAIRTIPQSQGATYTAGNGINISAQDEISIDDTVVQERAITFYADNMPDVNSTPLQISLYKDSNLSVAATYQEVADAISANRVDIVFITGDYTLVWHVSQYMLQDDYDNPGQLASIKFMTADGGTNGALVFDTSGIYPFNPSSNSLFDVVTAPSSYIYTLPTASSSTEGGIKVGSNLSISNAVLSAKDMTGATSSANGTAGYVPAPTTSDVDKFLKGDGTWGIPTGTTYSAGNGINISAQNVISATGATVVPVTLTLDSPAAGQFRTDKTFDRLYSEDVVEVFVGTFRFSIIGYDESSYIIYVCDGTDIYSLEYASGSATTGNYAITPLSVFTGATSSVAGAAGLVPAPAAGDEAKALHGDGTWKDTTAKLVEMSYGESSAWAKFIAAYNAGSIVYCRASSNANPGTGSQTRKAFMAYVNNAASPTSVEFQYVRSVSSKSSSQPVDQVFVYTLTNSNGGTWSVATRDMAPKIAAGTNTSVSYASGTYTISATPASTPPVQFVWMEDPNNPGNYNLFDSSMSAVADGSDVMNAFLYGPGAIMYDALMFSYSKVIAADYAHEYFVVMDYGGVGFQYQYSGSSWTKTAI